MIVNTGLYKFALEVCPAHIKPVVAAIYGDAADDGAPVDYVIALKEDSLVRTMIRPQVTFYCDIHSPFKALPLSQTYALLEWGMNWCIAAHDFSRLIIHAAVLVKNNKAIIFPAAPGSGKSTLSAYLCLSGWTLYSDEMAIIDLHSGQVQPMFRPVCLKNDSITIIKSLYPDVLMTPVCRDTQKGDVAHLQGISWLNYKKLVAVDIAGVVFPKYQADSKLTIYAYNQLQAFESLSKNAFNYNVLGAEAFNLISKISQNAALFELQYCELSKVEAFLTEEIIK